MWCQAHHVLDESHWHQREGGGCHNVTFTDNQWVYYYFMLPWFHCHGSDWSLCWRLSRMKWSQMASIDFISWAYFRKIQWFLFSFFFFTGIIWSNRPATFRQISPSTLSIHCVSLLRSSFSVAACAKETIRQLDLMIVAWHITNAVLTSDLLSRKTGKLKVVAS